MNSCILILSLFAAHPGAPDGMYEKFTPGGSLRCGAYETGYYRNSLGEDSVYAGVLISAPFIKARVLAGAVTGYPAAPVLPAISFVVDLSESAELVLIPGVETENFRSDPAMSVRFKF